MIILFLAANPVGTQHLALDEEARSIDQALRKSALREQFDLRTHWAVRIEDLQELLLRHQPDIVHFSGHGSQAGELIFQSGEQVHPVAPDAIGALFSVLKDNVRCVVLNACYSDGQAQAIAQHIDCVVGMGSAIGDQAALSFSTVFYQALGYGRSVKTAFDLGRIQIDLASLPENGTPKIIYKDDFVFQTKTKSGTRIKTKGGPHVAGSVRTGGGNFAGRDNRKG